MTCIIKSRTDLDLGKFGSTVTGPRRRASNLRLEGAQEVDHEVLGQLNYQWYRV